MARIKLPKRWTFQAVLDLLPKRGWKVHKYGMIRRNGCDCPIEAIQRLAGVEVDAITHYRTIGIPWRLAGDVAMAADNTQHSLRELRLAHLIPKRRRLLKHLGLKEVQT